MYIIKKKAFKHIPYILFKSWHLSQTNPDSQSSWLHTGQHCTNHRGYLAAAGPNTVFGKRAEFDVNIRTRASVLEGEGGLCGDVPEMYVPSLLH